MFRFLSVPPSVYWLAPAVVYLLVAKLLGPGRGRVIRAILAAILGLGVGTLMIVLAVVYLLVASW